MSLGILGVEEEERGRLEEKWRRCGLVVGVVDFGRTAAAVLSRPPETTTIELAIVRPAGRRIYNGVIFIQE